MYQLAAFRAVQGIGAGGLFSLALAIIGDIVPPRERAKYQGYFLAVFGTSSVLGPVIGGFFAGQATILGITGWRWVFLVNVPIGIAALVVVGARCCTSAHPARPPHRLAGRGRADRRPGAAADRRRAGPRAGAGTRPRARCLLRRSALVGIVAFILVERADGRRGADPAAAVPEPHLRRRHRSSRSFIGMGMFGGIAALPLYLQIVKGATPTQAGLQLLPLMLGHHGRLDPVRPADLPHRPLPASSRSSAALLLAASCFALHYTAGGHPALEDADRSWSFFGLGLGGNMQPMILAVQNAVRPRDIGVATSSATFFRQIGGTLGTAVFLSILFSKAAPRTSPRRTPPLARTRTSLPRCRTRRATRWPTPRSSRG